jgi:CHAD domain-containing protein
MHVNDNELRLPAGHGARLVALRLLDDASTEAEHLITARDDEALHDFRVAVRRLRSWLRAFDDELGDAIRGKDRKELRAIARASNPGRDVEVQLEWLAGVGARLNLRRRRGVRWMREYLALRRHGADAELERAVRDDFPPLRDRLRTSLSSFVEHVDMGGAAPLTLGSAIGEHVVAQANALGACLAQVHTVSDEHEAHEARIAAKRLRYLLEPVRDSTVDPGKVLKKLKSLQDGLGALHDTHVMAAELHQASQGSDVPVSAILSVTKRLQKNMKQVFGGVEDAWLDGRHERFLDDVRALAARLQKIYGD